VYLQDTIKIGEKVSIVGSGRVDYVPYLRNVVGSPRGSIVIKPTDRQAIRISGSTAFRTPSFLESYLSLPIQLSLPGVQFGSATKREDIPNFTLQPEQVTSAEVGYLNQMSDYFEVDLAAYYNRVTNLIELTVARQETLSDKAAGLGGFDPVTGRYTAAFGGWDNSADVYNVFGGEVGVRVYPVEGLDLFANYAINYTLQQHALPGTPDDQRTSHHKVNAGVQLATLSGIVYQQFPLPAYTLLNGRLGWRFYKDRIEVSATVFNALAGVFAPPPQMHPFGNQIGRRIMGFVSYSM
jgi:iron complex outermembrane receptor protein